MCVEYNCLVHAVAHELGHNLSLEGIENDRYNDFIMFHKTTFRSYDNPRFLRSVESDAYEYSN
jgi:predicted Zn-dependent protease